MAAQELADTVKSVHKHYKKHHIPPCGVNGVDVIRCRELCS